MVKSKVASLVLTLLVTSTLLVGCGDDNNKKAAAPPAQTQEQKTPQPTDEQAEMKAWNDKMEKAAADYVNGVKTLMNPSLEILGKQAASPEELAQNYKTVYQNLKKLSNDLVNCEMMYREIQIPDGVSKKEQMTQVQNLYGDATKKYREGVDIMKLMTMKGQLNKTEMDKATALFNEATNMFNDAHAKLQQINNQ